MLRCLLLQILDKELTHLEKAAVHLDPVTQRAEAATVKLLASALLQVRKHSANSTSRSTVACCGKQHKVCVVCIPRKRCIIQATATLI
jgi:hypothetical protein